MTGERWRSAPTAGDPKRKPEVRFAAGDEGSGPGDDRGRAEDRVKQIVTVSERKVAAAGHGHGQPIRGRILGENGRIGKQLMIFVLLHQHIC
jgi:hypothetical protein